MTERIYYDAAYLREFDATLLEVLTVEGRRAAILDRTAFYPTSGGQPFDTGTLGGARVIDVIDRDDGVVLHVVEGEVAPGSVHGRIDWDRRFEHMQQHTGQHVLSAAFDRVAHARTESFHLGTASATIDLAFEVSASQIAAAERLANDVVWENRPVRVRFVDAVEAGKLPLRKDPARTGRLRIVEVEDFDLSACGGTHVSQTGAIGNIDVDAFERFRGGTRVQFRCGVRALQGYRALRDGMAAAGRQLSTGALDVPAAIDRLQSENREARRRMVDLQERLARHEASALAARATAWKEWSIVLAALEGWDANGVKAIATGVASQPRHAAILVAGPPPSLVVVARAADVGIDASGIVKALTARFGGKGGGRPELAQGGGLKASPDEVLAAARTLLETQNSEFRT